MAQTVTADAPTTGLNDENRDPARHATICQPAPP